MVLNCPFAPRVYVALAGLVLVACHAGGAGSDTNGADAASARLDDRTCEPPAPRDALPARPDAAALADAAPGSDSVTDAAAAVDVHAPGADARTSVSDARDPPDSSIVSSDAGRADTNALADCPELDGAGPLDASAPDASRPLPDATPPAQWNVRRLFSDADGLAAPDGLHRMADGRVLVANQVTGDLQVIDPVAGTVELFFLHFPGLSKPEETADAPDGAVYVSDNVSRRVHRLDPDGTHEAVLGPADGLVEPKGLAVRPDGTLIIADEGGRQILAFTPGVPLLVLADPERGAASPESLQLAPDGTLYCTDDHQGGVLRIAPDGAVDQFLTPQQVRWADAVSVAPGGDLWFSEANPNTGPRLLHFTPAGVLVETVAVPGPGRMLGVAALADGRVLTAFYLAPYLASEIWVAEPVAPAPAPGVP